MRSACVAYPALGKWDHLQARAHARHSSTSSGMQGECHNEPAPLPPAAAHLSAADVPAGVCQLIIERGLLSWTSGYYGTPQRPAQPTVWLHGLHIVHTGTVQYREDTHMIVHWEPPVAARLFMTDVHVQGAHTALYIANGADALAVGAMLHPACSACRPVLGAD